MHIPGSGFWLDREQVLGLQTKGFESVRKVDAMRV